MAKFDDFWQELTGAISKLAIGALKDYKDQVQKDGQAFANKLKIDLQNWSVQLSEGQIDSSDLEFLVKGKKDLAELLALKQTGLAKVVLDKFFGDLVDTIISILTEFFPKL